MPQAPRTRSDDARTWSLLAFGTLAVTATIAFFILTSIRQDHLLEDGTRRKATVVDVVPAQGWNLVDLGRIVVSYEADGRSYREPVWLDDYTQLRPGDPVLVFTDPDDPTRVRTKDDQNTPADIGMWVLLAGLAGAVTAFVSGRRLIMDAADRRVARALPRHGFGPSRAASLRGPSTERVAWEEAAVRTAWRAQVRRVRDQVAIGAVVVALMTVAFILVDRHDDAFLRRGEETTATVTGGDYGGRYSSDHIDVSYVVDGVAYIGTVNDESPGDHPKGSTITLVYDPDSPREVRTPSNPNHSGMLEFLLFMPMMFGGGVFLVGLLGGLAALRWRRWLRSHATRSVHVTEGSLPRRLGEDAWLLRIRAPGPEQIDVVTRLTGPRRWLDNAPTWIGGAPGEFDGPALVCAGTGRRLVVFDPDVEIPVEVALPRTVRTARKWWDCLSVGSRR